MSWREGSSSASMPTRPCASGWRSRYRPNASKPRTMFFVGSVRSTRSTVRSQRICSSSRPAAEHLVTLAELVELARVDGDRVGGDERQVDLAENRRSRVEEVVAPAMRVEPDDVVREQALVERHATTRGRRPHASGRGQGMWTKCESVASGRAARTIAGAR